jgi:polyhydroxyalkanoate synthesis regulator phasin
MKKGLAALLVVFGMALGSVLTAVLNPIGAASALVGASSSTVGSHESVLQQALDTLVGKGTITKSQADAVKNQVHSLEQQRAKSFAHDHPFPAFGGPMDMPHGALEQLFSKLGADPMTLFDELKAGKTLADIAKEKGINVATLKSEVIADATKAIDTAVKNGWMTATEAATLKARLPSHLDELLNRKWNQGFEMPGMMPGFHGHGPSTAPAGPAAPGKGTTTTTTH